ncbi:unnamed protein product, partial [Mesorhabditis spiculigera]
MPVVYLLFHLISFCYCRQNSYGDELETPAPLKRTVCRAGYYKVLNSKGVEWCVRNPTENGPHLIAAEKKPMNKRRVKAPSAIHCGVKEVYAECGNACEPSCFYHDPACKAPCGRPACVCAPGLKRDTTRQLCVHSYECPQIEPSMFGSGFTDPCIDAACPPGSQCVTKEVNCSVPPCPLTAFCIAFDRKRRVRKTRAKH